jgi:hypothetical protein
MSTDTGPTRILKSVPRHQNRLVQPPTNAVYTGSGSN